MQALERKQDTRQKIQLGGLIKEAGLAEEEPAVIFGLLLEAAEILQSEQAEEVRKRWKLKGDSALTYENQE